MANRPETVRRCDQCGRLMAKAHRVYRGETYCTTCYYREFKHRTCPSCENRARLHRKYSDAVCLKCENSGKPCIRCGETEYSIGKVTDGGPVCKSCAVHYRPAGKCSYCGVSSKYLSRDFKAGFENPACPKCRRKDFDTCSVCRRHRMTELTPSGQPICKKCHESGEIACQICHEPMPAGYGNHCETCALKQRLAKAINLHSEKFSSAEMAFIYREFSSWLVNTSGLKKSVSALYRYHKFFLEIEPIIHEPISYEKMLAQYGAEGLRRWMLPVQFLIEKFELKIDEGSKLKDSECRRIARLLKKLPAGSQVRSFIDAYHKHLLGKMDVGETNIKSMRLAITPAVDLVRSFDHDDVPSQYQLNAYLRRKPGQRAAISGFVGFMKSQYHVDWELPKKVSKSKIYERQEAEMLLVRLLRKPKPNEIYRQRLLRAQLRYLHGLSIKSKGVTLEVKENDKMGKYVEYSGKRYWLPE